MPLRLPHIQQASPHKGNRPSHTMQTHHATLTLISCGTSCTKSVVAAMCLKPKPPQHPLQVVSHTLTEAAPPHLLPRRLNGCRSPQVPPDHAASPGHTAPALGRARQGSPAQHPPRLLHEGAGLHAPHHPQLCHRQAQPACHGQLLILLRRPRTHGCTAQLLRAPRLHGCTAARLQSCKAAHRTPRRTLHRTPRLLHRCLHDMFKQLHGQLQQHLEACHPTLFHHLCCGRCLGRFYHQSSNAVQPAPWRWLPLAATGATRLRDLQRRARAPRRQAATVL